MIYVPDIDPLTIPGYALALLGILEEGGYEAWIVGGFVRDALRGSAGNDIDIATSAPWQKTQELCQKHHLKTFESGTKHGTITVLTEGHTLEVTTFREEGSYTDKRHPDSVTFIQDIEHDLARRDFTINALAYHPSRGLCDPYGGYQDIKTRCIRTVGNAEQRFNEDALRILRACRFCSQLGFSIEATTQQAMLNQKEQLDTISIERITHELNIFVRGTFVYDALMSCFPLIAHVIPEILPMENFDQKTPYHIYDVLEHTAYCMQHCPSFPLVRWAAFFHDIGKPATFFTDEAGVGHFYGHAAVSVDLSYQAMKRLKMPSSFIHEVLLLVKHHDDIISPNRKAVKRALRRFEEKPELFRALCALKRGDALAQAPHCYGRVELADELEKTLDALLEEREVFSLRDLSLKGEDILALGIAPGPHVRALLDYALEAVIDERVPNERTSLIQLVRQYLDEETSPNTH